MVYVTSSGEPQSTWNLGITIQIVVHGSSLGFESTFSRVSKTFRRVHSNVVRYSQDSQHLSRTPQGHHSMTEQKAPVGFEFSLNF